MPKEYLAEVLNKFAQVTSILVESSKIKEYLDTKCKDDEDLKVILERTKTQVDNLREHADTVKELFYHRYKAVSEQLNTVNGKESGESEQIGAAAEQRDPLGTDSVNQCEVSSTKSDADGKKPRIKLVDINKLVEPKSVIKKESSVVKEKKNVGFDTTVVIITSSDEEQPKRRKSPNFATTTSKRKAAVDTIKKTRIALKDSSSDSDFSTSGKRTNKGKVRNGRRKAKLDDKIELSDTSDWSDDSVSKAKQPTKSKKKANEAAPENKIEEAADFDLENDPKFKAKCCVKLLRIPCENLKEYYLEKLDLLEVKKLSDVSSLKRKKRSKPGSDKSSDSETNENKKRKTTKKTEDDDSSTTDIDIPKNEDAPVTKVPTPEASILQETNDAAAEDAMNLLNSDQDEDKEESSDEAPEREPTPEKTAQEEGETAEVPESGENEPQKEKDGEETDGEKEKKDEDSEPAVAEDAEETEEKENKNEDKSKKAWRKDKLLTAKLSSSDSEEEFQKFQRKKDKMQDEVLSDEEPKAKDKKRMLKKRMKKKKILSDSESDKKDSSEEFQKASSSSSSESEKEEKEDEGKKKTARKRVKRVRDSSDSNDEDKSTRKQIRNILGRDSLAETTKQAEAEERERKARIAEKQKKYNQIYDNTYERNARVEKVVLDFDEENNKELLRVDDEIVKKLKPHQASGVQFMWDACYESLERAKNTKGSGCILAHCMGLGKTLQVIALTHTLLVNSEETDVRKVMVVSPLNTVLNWVNEYKQWLPDLDDFEIYELVSFKQNYERLYQVKTWHQHGGVLIIGYDMFRNLSNPENKRIGKKMRQTFQEALVNPGPDLVICDEGHLLKNEKTNLSIAMNRLATMRRIVLTGTPLQNNLKEYFCMVQFIKPNLLGTYKEYLNRFVNPITNGQYTDSTLHDIQVMRRRSHVLHKMLDGVVQRRDYSVLAPYLPPKHEFVLFLSLTEVQVKLYRHYMDHFARRSTEGSNRTSFLFVDFQALQRICTHPRVLLDKSNEMKLAKEKNDDTDEDSEGSLKDFINDDEDEGSSTPSSGSADDDDDEEGNAKKSSSNRKRVTRAAAALAKESGEDLIALNDDFVKEAEKEWWQEYCDGDQLNDITHSSKLFLLFEILKECEQIGDKVLVFSQSLYSLNVIEYFLGRIHDATQADQPETVGGYSGSWCLGLDYFRLDGSSSCDSRTTWCKIFNDPANTRSRLFLISTKAGGLGINLVAANRVIIFDVSWNPSHDIQSIYRVYRFGQTKPCYIYRFVTNGTMEMKIYERQVIKQSISKRVIDEQQIDRHYNQNDLAELYKFDPSPDDRPIPLVPKDVLLGELLQKFEDRIYKYHEHQTLLENKEEEGLNEEERKAAWEEFENEKKQRNMGFSVYNSQQTIIWEQALMNILRRENALWTDVEMRAMLPAMQLQLQEQLKQKDFTLYRQVQQEIQLLQAVQSQKMKEHYYQQQALRMLQQQQQQQQRLIAGMKMQNSANFLPYMNQMPGSSAPNTISQTGGINPHSKTTDVIDLND